MSDSTQETATDIVVPAPVQVRSPKPERQEASVSNVEAAAKPQQSLADLVELVERSVVAIETTKGGEGGLGSGFVADHLGIIVTNYHVIDGASSAEVHFNDGTVLPALEILFLTQQRDIAVLRTRPIPEKHPALSIEATMPRKGESVYAFGSPLGLSGSASDGIISGVRSGRELSGFWEQLGVSGDFEGTWLQTTAPISKGNSGGPLVNSEGHVVGLATLRSQYFGGENINFAISCFDIAAALEAAAFGKGFSFAEALARRAVTDARPATPPPDDRGVAAIAVVQGTVRGVKETASVFAAQAADFESQIRLQLVQHGFTVNNDPKAARQAIILGVRYMPATTNITAYECSLYVFERRMSVDGSLVPVILWSKDFHGGLAGKTSARQIELALDSHLRTALDCLRE